MLLLPWLGLGLVLGLSQGTQGARGSLHCAERRDISPCTCSPISRTRVIEVVCERMTSFGQVVTALRGRFQPDVRIALTIAFSQLDDFPERGFDELGMSVLKLTLKGNKLSQLPEEAFAGLNGTVLLSLADNSLPTVPSSVLALMPKVQTLDMANSKLTAVRTQDFKALSNLEYLVLVGNAISTLERDSLPRTMKNIHLGSNQLRNLNGTLRELSNLRWLFLDFNLLTSLDGELPERGLEQLALVFAANNRLERLPAELRHCPRLDTMLASNNSLTSLNGVFSRARQLVLLELNSNKIKELAEDDFTEAENIDELHLGYNQIEALHTALQRIRALQYLNLTHNNLAEFSLQEIRGLQKLKMVDLSHNRIARLSGRMDNVVDSETRVEELRLEYNVLVSLDGALGGIQGLERLNLSHNLLDSISPDDLIGLDQLKTLDVSHNRLRTLEETSKTFMPALEELMASHNLLESLERDFHGLPVLCRADLSSNNISRIHPELTTKTRCKVHGVNSVLRITLHDNPVRCDEQLARTLIVFQSNLTELQGVPQCALAVPHMLLLGALSLNGVQVPVQVPVLPALPALYSGVQVPAVPGVQGVPGVQTVPSVPTAVGVSGLPGVPGVGNAQPPTLVLGGYPMAPLQAPASALAPLTPIVDTTLTTSTMPPPVTTVTTTTTVTTETALPSTFTIPPTEGTNPIITTTSTPPTTTPEPGQIEEQKNLPVSESEPKQVPVSEPEKRPDTELRLEPELKSDPEIRPETRQDQKLRDEEMVEKEPMVPAQQAVPVLKELPPVIQLLQPEVSVQQSKDLPRLVDPELLVLAAAPMPAPPPAPSSTPPPPPDPQPEAEPQGQGQGSPPASPDEAQDEAPDEPPEPLEPPDSTTPSSHAMEPMAADSPPLILIQLLNETALPVRVPVEVAVGVEVPVDAA